MNRLINGIRKRVQIRTRARRVRWFVQAEIDNRRLAKVFPEFEKLEIFAASAPSDLRAAYQKYTREYTSEVMAASWQTSCLLYAVAKAGNFKRILDLGSGFSSYALRAGLMHAQARAHVQSVDDDSVWLEKTRGFLSEHGMPIDDLATWSDFVRDNRSRFDFIFYDLGRMDTRAELLPVALRLLEDGGIIVLDDMHKPPYRKVAKSEVKRAGLRLYSLRKLTLDNIGRFSEIAT